MARLALAEKSYKSRCIMLYDADAVCRQLIIVNLKELSLVVMGRLMEFVRRW